LRVVPLVVMMVAQMVELMADRKVVRSAVH
jgi:hypothetical protein